MSRSRIRRGPLGSAVVALVIAGAACTTGVVSARPAPLAYATADGVYVLPEPGARPAAPSVLQVGPAPASGMTIGALRWSPDGRRLAWLEEAAPVPAGAAGAATTESLVIVDVASRALHRWTVRVAAHTALGNPDLGWTAHGVAALSTDGLTTYRPDGTADGPHPVREGARPVAPVGSEAAPDLVQVVGGRPNGLVVIAPQVHGPWPVEQIDEAGTITHLASLPGAGDEPDRPPYGRAAIDPTGSRLVLEQGDHTDGCGVGPTSDLVVVELATGEVNPVMLPDIEPVANRNGADTNRTHSGSGLVQRVSTVAWGPRGTLDVALYRCAAVGAPPAPDHPTALWERGSRGWRRLRNDVLQAQPGEGGTLAFVQGHFTGEADGFGPVGDQQLWVQPRTGPTGRARPLGRVIAFAVASTAGATAGT